MTYFCRPLSLVCLLTMSLSAQAAEPAASKSSAAKPAAAKDATADSEAAAADATPPPETDRLPEIEAAEGLLRAGDFEGARKKLAEAQKKNPSLAAPGVIIARWHLANHQIGPMRAELEQVVAQAPAESEPYALLGELAWRDGRIAETELLFREALVRSRAIKDPTRKAAAESEGHAGLASVAERRKRWSAARDELAAWAAVDEKNPIPHQRMGLALFRLGKPKEALAEYQTAAKQNRELVPELALAALYDEADDHENAVRWSNAAVKRLPDQAGVRLAIATRDLEHDRLAEAKRQVEAARTIDPDAVEANILAGGIVRLEHDSQAAQRYLESAHGQALANFVASNLLALSLADGDDPAGQARALELAQQNFGKNPQNSEAMATLGWVLFRLGRFDEAGQRLHQAMATGKLNADGAYFVARICQREGKFADAKTLLSKALATKRRFAYQDDAEQLLAKLESSDAEKKPEKKPQPATPSKPAKPAR